MSGVDEDVDRALIEHRCRTGPPSSESRSCSPAESNCSSDVEGGPEEPRQCRICLEADGTDFIAPCHCRGFSKYVHRDCLDQWRSVKEGAAFSKCTTCQARYRFSIRPPQVGARAAKFGFLVARDTLAISATTQMCICLYALDSYVLDLFSSGALKRACGFQNSVQFYYLFGLFIFFFVAGVLGRQISRAQREQHSVVLLTLRQRRRRPRASRAQRIADVTVAAGAVGPTSPRGLLLESESLAAPLQPQGVGSLSLPETLPDLRSRPSETGVLRRALSNISDDGDLEEGLGLGAAPRSMSASEGVPLVHRHRPSPEDVSAADLPANVPGGDSSTGAGIGAARARDRRVLLRFRHTVELTPHAIAKGSLVAFVVGFVAIGLIEFGVATERLDGFFVLCLAAMSVPTGVLYTVKLLKTIWDSHRCVLTKRQMTEEYVVEDLEGDSVSSPLSAENEAELRHLGLW